jgi:FdrA protein
MTVQHVEVRAGAYADSVTLMQVSRRVTSTDGVAAALVAMATPLNLDLLAAMQFPPPDPTGPNDLLIAIRARDETALRDGLGVVNDALTARPVPASTAAGEEPPRTFSSAVRRTGPGPALALISVPGPHAFTEAMDALDAGCDVMIFSDNVPIEQEITLKDVGAQRSLLVLGPDCGTAVIGGVGLGFSHTVAAGPVGIVAASGTGAQQVLCLLDAANVGVSAALGVGGRDQSTAVAGRSTRAALSVLDADPSTELIMLVSKPPDEHVASELRSYAEALTTPVQFALVGEGQPDLTAATEETLRRLGVPVPSWPQWRGRAVQPRGGFLRGLFAGGTLCDEAMVIATERLGRVRSNIPLHRDDRVDPTVHVDGHVMIDFGDDQLTAGRPHPMIDPFLRLERFAAEVNDSHTAVVLLDIVLGHGAQPDPAADFAPAIASASERDVAVVVSLIGAQADPQDLPRQAELLSGAGAHVFASNAAAARFACGLIIGQAP